MYTLHKKIYNLNQKFNSGYVLMEGFGGGHSFIDFFANSFPVILLCISYDLNKYTEMQSKQTKWQLVQSIYFHNL